MEVLALAFDADLQISGIPVTVSAFVDDPTVFLYEARQLPRVLDLDDRFGRLSGLQVQPSKSKLIFLNLAVQKVVYHGIPVFKHGDTTRLLSRYWRARGR